MIQKLIKKNIIMMKNYNKVTRIIRNALEEAEKKSSIEFIHNEDTSKSMKKMIFLKKLLDLSIFIDEKDSLIDD
jgi:gamma-glutamyl phosphate reductase